MKPFKHQVIRQLLLSGKSVADTAAEAMSTIGYVNTVRREMIAGLAKAKKPAAKKKAVKRAAQKKTVKKPLRLEPMGLVEMSVASSNPNVYPVTLEKPSVWRRFLLMLGSK